MWFEETFQYQAWERTDVDIEEEEGEDEEGGEEEDIDVSGEEEEVSSKLLHLQLVVLARSFSLSLCLVRAAISKPSQLLFNWILFSILTMAEVRSPKCFWQNFRRFLVRFFTDHKSVIASLCHNVEVRQMMGVLLFRRIQNRRIPTRRIPNC